MPDITSFNHAILNGNIEEIVELVNKAAIKASINNVDHDGKTPLILAVETNFPEVIEILVKNGANVNLAIKGSTALMIAAQSGRHKMAKALILAGADTDKVVGFGKITALKLAKKHLSLDKFQEMELAFKEAQTDLGAKKQQRGESAKGFQKSPIKSSPNKGISGGNIIQRKTQGR